MLKDDGILAFSYHHSRAEGWESVAQAVCRAGFSFINAQPVKAEMSGATPKSQAEEPIQLDTIFVCRKTAQVRQPAVPLDEAISRAFEVAVSKEERLRAAGFKLSANDLMVIYSGQALAAVGHTTDTKVVQEAIGGITLRLGLKLRREPVGIETVSGVTHAVGF